MPSVTVVKEEKKSGETEGLAKTKPSDMKPDQGGGSMVVRPAPANAPANAPLTTRYLIPLH